MHVSKKPHIHTADSAEKVRKAVEATEKPDLDTIFDILKDMPLLPSPPITEPPYPPSKVWRKHDCGCPLSGTCMNVSCPRRIDVTYGVGWPE